MPAPLYDNRNSPDEHRDVGHRGLWFDRFFNLYNEDWSIPTPQENNNLNVKQKWISDTAKKVCGDETALKNYALKQKLLTENHLEGITKAFKNNWHFVTGMGNEHPVENGMSWHSTLGVPYLSGAAVKGLLRAWMEEWFEFENVDKKEKLRLWFGSDNKDPEKQEKDSQAGGLIFFDALPVKPVSLACDIMTPHMGKWYSDGAVIQNDTNGKGNYADTLPADWHSPNPIPFLVAKKTSLQFCIAPRPDSRLSTKDAAEAMEQLSQALEFIGAGAKTAVGYGYFSEDVEYKKQFQSAKERIKTEISQLTSEEIIRIFGREKNKLKNNIVYIRSNESWNIFIEQIKNEFSEDLKNWKENPKQHKFGFRAYKTIYEQWQDWTPPDWEND